MLNLFLIHTYLSSVILALALMVPNAPQEKQNPAPPASPAESASAMEVPKNALLSMEDHASAIAADYDINPVRFKRLITCESRWMINAAGDSGTSLGILQFKASTFAHFTKKYDLEEYDYGIQDPYQQMDLAARMIRDGYIGHWKNCARKTGWSSEPISRK